MIPPQTNMKLIHATHRDPLCVPATAAILGVVFAQERTIVPCILAWVKEGISARYN